jgi:hypothetical protein
MGVTHDVAPALYVARVFFMLPFTRLKHRRPTLRSPLWLRFVTFTVHIVLLIPYIYETWKTLLNLKHATNIKSIQGSTEYATLLIMQGVDLMNFVTVVILSQKTCKMTEKVLRSLNATLKIKHIVSKMPIYLSIYTSVTFFLKLSINFFYFDKLQLTTRLFPYVGTAILLATEHLLFVLCFEIKEQLKYINLSLRNSTNSAPRVARLCHAFEKIIYAQGEINRKFGPFLFFNISQLFLNMLHTPVLLISSCVHVASQDLNCSIMRWLAFSYILVMYIMRFSMICWFCSIISKEVISY